MKRVSYIKKQKADYLLSIHYNTVDPEKIKNGTITHPELESGIEIYFYGIANKNVIGNGKRDYCEPNNCISYNNESRLFAEQLSQYLTNRGYKNKVLGSDLFLLSHKPAEKSVIIELGYLCNPIERAIAQTSQGRLNSVQLIADFFKDTNFISDK